MQIINRLLNYVTQIALRLETQMNTLHVIWGQSRRYLQTIVLSFREYKIAQTSLLFNDNNFWWSTYVPLPRQKTFDAQSDNKLTEVSIDRWQNINTWSKGVSVSFPAHRRFITCYRFVVSPNISLCFSISQSKFQSVSWKILARKFCYVNCLSVCIFLYIGRWWK